MANLVVRQLDEAVVRALKRRAAENQRSAEAEHRAILHEALMQPTRKPFARVLAEMPNAGDDTDFARDDTASVEDVFS